MGRVLRELDDLSLAKAMMRVMEFFREERLREQRERHEMELAKVRASVPQQPVFINQPSATNGICLSSEEGTGIGQVNVGDNTLPDAVATNVSFSINSPAVIVTVAF